MTTTNTVFYRLVIMSDPSGNPAVVQHETKSAKFVGDEQVSPWQPDQPTSIPLPLSTELLGGVNAALTSRIADLETQLATAQAGPVAPVSDSDALLSSLADVFAQIPKEVQSVYAADYGTVRTLLQAGRKDLAHDHVISRDVPTDLIPIRDQIAAILAA